MRKVRSTTADYSPPSPGAFLSDGSFSETAEMRHRGHLDGLVRALVKQRRAGSLSVPLACRSILASNAAAAFPSVEQWGVVNSWPLCHAETSAEEAVKREGRGVEAHWCGERWMPGPTQDCPEERHRAARCPPECQAAFDAAFATLGAGSSGDEAPPPMQGGLL